MNDDTVKNMLSRGPLPGSRFRHYKGGLYEVVTNAIHESQLEHLVIYKNAKGTIWARSYEDWSSLVQVDGKTLRRFTEINEAMT